ncbi:MAG: hypothetical protein OEO23_04450 [Gemmatimonadota bacterium]|nr:hypothetical protein [Gemmatimonadota bacterium]
MNINLLDDALHALNRAAAAAARVGQQAVAPEHILAGVISEGGAAFEEACERLELDLELLSEDLRSVPSTYEGHLPFTETSHAVLAAAVNHSQTHQHGGVTSLHLFLGLLRAAGSDVQAALKPWDVDADDVADEINSAFAAVGGDEDD